MNLFRFWLEPLGLSLTRGLLLLAMVGGILLLKPLGVRGWQGYTRWRRKTFEPLLRTYLLNPSASRDLLKPHLWGDREVLFEMLLELSERHKGEIGDRLRHLLTGSDWLEQELLRLGSMRSWIRARAALRLGLIHDRRSRAGLARAFMDRSPRVRQAAGRALFQVDPEMLLRLLPELFSEHSVWQEPEADEFVRFLGGAAAPALQAVLDRGNLQAQKRAIHLLGTIGDSSSLVILNGLLQHPLEEIRASAKMTLGNCYNENRS